MALKADSILLVCGVALSVPAIASAADRERYDPYAKVPHGRHELDMSQLVRAPDVMSPVEQPDLSRLGNSPAPAAAPLPPGQLPEGWVQLGEVVQRREIAEGLKEIDPEPLPAWEDIEGNQYPRKGTVFLNFNGGMLKAGDDNSAENKSSLARHNHPYPVFNGTEATALSLIQAVGQDMETLGVRIVYLKRPSKIVPYTMAMVGGSWTDVNIGDPAGGVAPGTDCEDRDQRNVVYAFDGSSATVSQEVAHAWGLDHTLGSDRIMSYQFGSNKHFGDNCQALCEEQCQGPGSIGCRLIHEIYCGVDSEQQNDLAELSKIFGGTDPDTEPPSVEITVPAEEEIELPVGSDIEIQSKIQDDYGGVGWKLKVTQNDMVVYDQVDYDRLGRWFFAKLPEGKYVVELTAEDHADHVVTDVATIWVPKKPCAADDFCCNNPEDPCCVTPDDPCCGGGNNPTEGGVDSCTGGTSSTGGTSGSDTMQYPDDKSDGCGCRSSEQGAAGALGLPLFGLWLAHRARRRRRA